MTINQNNIPTFLVVVVSKPHKNEQTRKNGIAILVNNKAPIKNGENTVTNEEIKLGLKLLTLAIFPVPKNDKKMKKTNK